MVTEEMILAMLKDIPQDQIAKMLPQRIAAAQKIRERIRSITRRGDEAREVFNATNTSLQNELKIIQAECKHYTSTYHSDPSGGGDSYYDCPVCGAILR